MGATDAVIVTGSTFSRVMLGGCGTVTLLFLINSVFRGAGDAAIAMRVLWFANTINIVLGPTLIFGLGPFPEMGVVGAATATTIGRGCGVLYQLLHLTRPGGGCTSDASTGGSTPEAMRSILRISGTATFQNFVATASWMGLIKILSGFGSAAVAGNTIGIRIVLFALLPSFGVSNARGDAGGPESRRRRYDRQARRRRGRPASTCLGVVGVIFLVFRAPADRNLHLRSEVAPYIRCLRIVAAGFFFYGYGMVLTQAFNAGPAIPAPVDQPVLPGSGRFRWLDACLPPPAWVRRACSWRSAWRSRRWRSSAPGSSRRDVEDEAGIAPARRPSAPRCRSDRRLDVRRERAGPRSPKTRADSVRRSLVSADAR